MKMGRTGRICVFMVLGILTGPAWSGVGLCADQQMLERLEQIIQKQQAQIEAQSQAIAELKQELEQIKAAGTAARASDSAAAGAEQAPAAPPVASSGKAAVSLYGQVNRGVLYADDGNKGRWYQVDNDNSSTRIGLKAKATPADELEVGTHIEVQFEDNSTADVNQQNRRGATVDHFTKRQIYLYLQNSRFGNLSVGFGSTASDGTSEMDLSGTSVIGYSGVADMAGGILFYDSSADMESAANVGSAFSNMDGLSRDTRVRYDSPSFYGVQLSGSWIADGGGDLAARYAAGIGDFKLAAALAWADPGSAKSEPHNQYNGSLSMLHQPTGLSLTLAGFRVKF